MEHEVEEIWKPINGYLGRYEVSNYGRIKDNNYYGRGEAAIKSQPLRGGKYPCVFLTNPKTKKVSNILVQDLVVEYFMPWKKNTNCILKHVDGDLTNNYIGNLTFITKIEALNLAPSKFTDRLQK